MNTIKNWQTHRHREPVSGHQCGRGVRHRRGRHTAGKDRLKEVAQWGMQLRFCSDGQWRVTFKAVLRKGKRFKWKQGKKVWNSALRNIFLVEGVKVKVLGAQSWLTLCNPMDRSPPGFSIHGILQAKILEWAAISFSWGSSRPRGWTWVFCIAGRFFTIWATREAQWKV